MGSSERGRRSGWRILLGVEDDAALRRALLSAGRERRDAGATVVVGCFEPPQTEAAGLDGMPVVPLLPTAHASDQVDMQAIRERRPDVVLLDDLARLTPPEAERTPAVDAIRSLGIDVIRTLRAGEIASLAHALSPSSRASATVPDRALLEADDVEVVDDDPGWALARVAEAEGAQLVVQGGTVEGRLVLDVPTAGTRGLDLYVVAPSAGQVETTPVAPGAGSDIRSFELSCARRVAGYIAAVVGIPLLTLVLAGLRGSVHLSTVLLLYLAVTIAVIAVGGRGPGLVAAVGGFALGDYFFTRPYFRWVIDDPNVIIAIVFAVVAATVSVLVDVAARRSAEAARARAEATALARLATAVLTSDQPLPRLLHDLRAVFDLDAVAILRRADDGWAVEHAVGRATPRRPADATDALAIGPHRYLALVGPRTPAEDSRVLAAFTAQLALTVDRCPPGDPS